MLVLASLVMLLVPASALAQPGRPVIERIEPTSGPPGTEVAIVARRMPNDGTVLLGDRAMPVTRRAPNRWTVTVPDGATSGVVSVRCRLGTFTGPEFHVTAPLPPPTVARIEPGTGVVGSEVALTGEHFSTRLTDNVVTMGSLPVVVRAATETTLRIVVPDGALSGPFSVRIGQSARVQSPPFNVTALVRIARLEPERGPPGTVVTIRGTGFSTNPRDNRVTMSGLLGGNRVTENSVLAAAVGQSTATELRVTIPPRATTSTLLVDVARVGRAQSTIPFTIQFPPTLTGFEPTTGVPGTTVTLTGANFGDDPRAVRVDLGGRPLTLRRVTPTELRVEVVPGTATARFQVTVSGLGPAVSARDFVIQTPVAITGFQPTEGPSGTVVTIRGQGFSPVVARNHVTVSGAAANVVSASPDELRVRIPGQSSGSIEVSVEGSTRAVTNQPFVVTTPPTIVDFEPASGSPGSEIAIRGSHFGSSAALVAVILGGRRMELRSVTEERIVAVVPLGSASGRIAVTVRLQGTAASAQSFEVIAPVAVSAIEPTTAHPGARVAVVGEGFTEGTVVRFAGGRDVIPSSITNDRLTVFVPDGARTGPVTVRLLDRRTATTDTSLTVGPPPSGVAVLGIDMGECGRTGCDVILHGYGFSARRFANRVTFGDARVTVQRSTPTILSILVPQDAAPHPFRVQVQGAGEALSEPFALPVP